ncbi:hydroxyacid dehydrogenase [Aliidongia dinghuensis]|uniref:Hydroxyacid dehydrogenase n=1 Tax=Aliidongia dinghuensis TaxID=1867774 RepID=A0A8J2YWS2_9PROT|nr:hydroxyacid dehydrogenase [Aliidongia dinghuensis]GGF30569.1 hydroxyacid dehydrogenase [Aliidongia dinghuensis]
MSHRVVVTASRLARPAIDRLEAFGARLEFLDDALTEGMLLAVAGAGRLDAILMRNNPPITRRVIAAAEGLRVIAKHGAGYDSVDVAAATEAGVPVLVAAGANAYSVAEHTIALILALGRDVVRLDGRTKAGLWDKWHYSGRELRGRTLGLVGFGAIARHVARLARALGLEVQAFSRRLEAIDPALARPVATLDELYRTSDIASLHCPLGPETRGMINAATLARFKPGALLINTARGGLVDEAAVTAALHGGRLAGAALETFTAEPPAADNPLFQAPNLIVTPHIGAHTAEAETQMGLIAAENIIAVLSGAPLDPANLVNPGVLDRPHPSR